MQTRTRNAAFLLAVAVAGGSALVWMARGKAPQRVEGRALDAIPSDAMLVATADLAALRASPAFATLLRDRREIPGLGKVRDVCGFDPLDSLTEVALAIPAAGDAGEFGLSAGGPIDDDALLTCATKVIEARGGKPVVTSIGSFRSVRDASSSGGGEIAARKGGPLLLGGGAYLRSMIDAADGRTPALRASPVHAELARAVGDASLRVTVALTPEQRRALAEELASGGAVDAPASAITAGALGAKLGPTVALRGVLTCDREAACRSLAASLDAARAERAADITLRLAGIGGVLEEARIELRGAVVHASAAIPEAQAASLAERLLALRGLRPSPPEMAPAPAVTGSPSAAPRPDEVVTPGTSEKRPTPKGR